MRYGHGTCTILQHSLKWLKVQHPLNVKGHGKVPYQKPQTKVYGVWHILMYSTITACTIIIAQCDVPTKCTCSIGLSLSFRRWLFRLYFSQCSVQVYIQCTFIHTPEHIVQQFRHAQMIFMMFTDTCLLHITMYCIHVYIIIC